MMDVRKNVLSFSVVGISSRDVCTCTCFQASEIVGCITNFANFKLEAQLDYQ